MVAISRTSSEPTTSRQRMFAFLDSLQDLNYSHTLMFEAHNPGARDSLLVYCALHGVMVECREITVGNTLSKSWRAEMRGGAVVEVQL